MNKFLVVKKPVGQPPVLEEWDPGQVKKLQCRSVIPYEIEVDSKKVPISIWVTEDGLTRKERRTNFVMPDGTAVVDDVHVTRLDRRRKPLGVGRLNAEEAAAVQHLIEQVFVDGLGVDPSELFVHVAELPSTWKGPRFCVATPVRHILTGAIVCHYGETADEALENYRSQLFFGLLGVDFDRIVSSHLASDLTPLGEILRWSSAYCADPPGTILWLLGRLAPISDLDPVLHEFLSTDSEWRGGLELDQYRTMQDFFAQGFSAQLLLVMSRELRRLAANQVEVVRALVGDLDQRFEAQDGEEEEEAEAEV